MGPFRSTVLACALLAGAHAGAATVEARVTTLAGVRPQRVDGEVLTTAQVLESVRLHVSDIQNPLVDDLRVMLAAWGMLGPSPRADLEAQADVDLAFIEGRIFKKHLRVRLGRQMVVGGVSRISYIDGVALDLRGPAGLSAGVSLGVPVGPRFSLIAQGGWQLNARVQLAPNPWLWNVGASFVHSADRLGVSRQEIGLDGRWYLLRQLTLAGAAMFSVVDKRFSEVDLGPRWQPTENFELAAGYRRTAPDLLVSRTSIFSVFADTNRDEVGGSLFWAPAEWLTLYADGRGLFIEEETGVDLTARVTFRRDRRGRSQLSLQGRWLRVPENGYLMGRVSALHQLRHGITLSAELDGYWFDKEINARRASVTAAGSVHFAFSPQWSLAVSVLGGSTPAWASRVEAFARLTWMAPELKASATTAGAAR